jgi:para-nitrobenzyl esterase
MAASGELTAFAPAVGSVTLPRQGADALAAGDFLRVPLINGGNRDEMRLYVGYDVAAGKRVTPANYLEKLGAIYGAAAAAVASEYPLAAYSSAPAALGTALSDFMPGGGLSNCLYLRGGRLAARHAPVFEYEFADRGAPPVMPDPGFELGAVHAAELPYQFPHISHTYKVDGPDLSSPAERLAGQMLAYWSRFAHSGSPQADGLPAWKRYTSEAAVFRFDAGELGAFDATAAHHCVFWQRLYPGILGH